jgi:hypothetical protein
VDKLELLLCRLEIHDAAHLCQAGTRVKCLDLCLKFVILNPTQIKCVFYHVLEMQGRASYDFNVPEGLPVHLRLKKPRYGYDGVEGCAQLMRHRGQEHGADLV